VKYEGQDFGDAHSRLQTERMQRSAGTQVDGKFYKKGSQEKTLPHRPECFLLRSPLD
jgi:hypothetical protein